MLIGSRSSLVSAGNWCYEESRSQVRYTKLKFGPFSTFHTFEIKVYRNFGNPAGRLTKLVNDYKMFIDNKDDF